MVHASIRKPFSSFPRSRESISPALIEVFGPEKDSRLRGYDDLPQEATFL